MKSLNPLDIQIPNYLTEEEPIYRWTVGQVIEARTDPSSRTAAWNSYQPRSSEEAFKHPLTIQIHDMSARCTDWDDEFMIACIEFGLDLYDVLWPLAQGEKNAGEVLEHLNQTRPTPASNQNHTTKPTGMYQPSRENDAHVMSFWMQELIIYGDNSPAEERQMRREVNGYLKRMAETTNEETLQLLNVIHRVAQHQDPEVAKQGLAFSEYCWRKNALQLPDKVSLQPTQTQPAAEQE